MRKIIEKIYKMLKLNEEGKLEKFFSLLEKRLKQDRAKLEHNKKTLELTYSGEMTKLEEQLEDAEASIEDAVLNVTTDALVNNNTMNEYMDIYLEGIKSAENTVSYLKETIKNTTEKYEKDIEKIDRSIGIIDCRLAQIKD